FIERMVVALGATQLRAQENLGDRLGAGDRFADGAIKIRRRIEIRATARGDEFAGEPVERFVFRDALANPAMERLDAFAVEQSFLGAQQVGPLERPEVGELGPFEQSIDQAGALPWQPSRCREGTRRAEAVGLFPCREPNAVSALRLPSRA